MSVELLDPLGPLDLDAAELARLGRRVWQRACRVAMLSQRPVEQTVVLVQVDTGSVLTLPRSGLRNADFSAVATRPTPPGHTLACLSNGEHCALAFVGPEVRNVH